MRIHGMAALLVFALGACGTVPPPAALPPDVGLGLADPTRNAIFNTSYAFATPANLAQQPADAALAVAQAEYLAVELPYGPRWREFSPVVPMAFERARAEWRSAVGIAPDAQPQPVINALFAARYALQQGDAARAAAALPAPLFQGGGAATLARLAALPALPQTANAASGAESELMRQQRGGRGNIFKMGHH
ncbi:hypothetical protein [Plastoroseomonas hellenica]|uniref:hypothetical protein n=1 Tax=Plastoroseomonas hellenica TaxID=2687306 RepID=UPI001BAD06F2|nr:hypothetical protein [Plastoroseomonas hellenica]MBR0646429.1 hypothetical protein [Plastoroseomonas hellenica]